MFESPWRCCLIILSYSTYAQSGQHQYADKFARSRGLDEKDHRPNVHWTLLDKDRVDGTCMGHARGTIRPMSL